ncbi:MAG: hypothetical protein ACUVX1_10630, partial [Chloroflexota bacterium]
PAEWATWSYGGTLVPVKNESVAILSERLVLDFAAARHYDHGPTSVPISASYRLRNESDTEQRLLVAFPCWTRSDRKAAEDLKNAGFRVAFNGAPLAFSDADIQLPDATRSTGKGLLRDLRDPGTWRLRAVSFEVSLKPRGEGALDVSYFQDAGVSRAESATADLVQLDYILQTARYWRDFRDLEIEMRAPRGMPLENSLALTPATADNVDVYRFASPTLPDSNLRVAVLWPVPWNVALLRVIGGGSDYAGTMLSLFLCLPLGLLALVFLSAYIYSRRGRPTK